MTNEMIRQLFATTPQIQKKQRRIYRELLATSEVVKRGNFTQFSEADLETLFRLYDRYFFNDYFTQTLGPKLGFYLSTRMTRSGGVTKYDRRHQDYEIGIAISMVYNSYTTDKRRNIINGRECQNRLEAVMSILEHEIIHLLEMVIDGKSSCKGDRFKELSRQIFGHKAQTHRLELPVETVKRKFNLKTGDSVVFTYDGQKYTGVISRITKRATVMVKHPDGIFADKKGQRYQKYYVPVHMLKKK